MITIRLFKVKKGKLNQWKQWCDTLMTSRHDEAVESIFHENVNQESCYLLKVETEYFVLGVTFFDKTSRPSDKRLKINQDHLKNRKECLDYVGDFVNLYNISTPVENK